MTKLYLNRLELTVHIVSSMSDVVDNAGQLFHRDLTRFIEAFNKCYGKELTVTLTDAIGELTELEHRIVPTVNPLNKGSKFNELN